MATIVTRSGKGSPLTNTEVDANFTNLNTELGTKANTASLATVATTGAYADLTGKPTNVSSFSNDSGYITGITSGNVTTALGFTPYNATNPSGYITSSALTPYALKTGAAFTGAISSTASVTAPVITTAASGIGSVYLNAGTASNTGYISFWNAAAVRQSYIGYSTANNNLMFQAEGSTGFSFNKTVAVTGGVTSTIGMHAPIFYDNDDTAYYVNPAATSVINNATFINNTYWQVSPTDAAVQRADARDDATNFSRLHWYGLSDDGATSNFRHAWYDGGDYINVTAGTGGRIDFSGSATSMHIGVNRIYADNYHPEADKWTTARTLSLSGDATGSVSWDGSANVTLPVAVVNDSHEHSFNSLINKTGGTGTYTTSGDFRAPLFYDSNNTAYYVDPTGGTSLTTLYADRYFQNATGTPVTNLGNPTVTEMALFDRQFNNKTAFYPAANLKFFTSTDGVTWTEYTSFTDGMKKAFVGGDAGSGVFIPNGTPYFRIELTNNGNYVYLNAFYMYWSASGNSSTIKIQKRRASDDVWLQHTNSSTAVAGWPSHVYLPFATIPYISPTSTSASHFDTINIDFQPTWANANNITLYNMEVWGGYPAGSRNIYSTDSDKNVTFPTILGANTDIRAPTFYDSDNTAFYADLANSGLSVNVAGYIEAANVSTNTQPTLGVTRMAGYGLIGNRAVWYLTNGGGDIQIGNGATHNASPSMTISANGITSLRNFAAPIFYDSDNSAYFIDPASTSNLTGLTVANTITGSISGSSASTTGNAATATTLQTARTISLAGDVTGSVSFNGSADVSLTATVVNDSHEHDGRYYTETEADGRFYRYLGEMGSAVDLDNLQTTGRWHQSANGQANGTGYPTARAGLLHVYGDDYKYQQYQTYDGLDLYFRTYYQSWSSWKTLLHSANYTSYAMPSGSSATNSVDVRAPIFYDSNDTAYYADLGSTSSSIRTAGPVSVGTTSSAVQLTVAGAAGVDGIDLQVDTTNAVNSARMFWTNGTSGQGNAIYNSAGNLNLATGATPNSSSGAARLTIYSSGYNQSHVQFRAPIFYDGDNTAYFIDGANTSVLNSLIIRNGSAGNILQAAASGNDQLTISGQNYTHALNLKDGYNTSNYAVISGGYLNQAALTVYGYSAQNVINNTSYYASNYATVSGTITATADVRAPIFYDSANTTYYVDPAGASQMYTLNMGAGITSDNGGVTRVTYPQGGAFSSSNNAITGAIKITLPVSWTDTMMSLRIRVFDYSAGESFELHCGGYNYATSSQWINTFAYIVGEASNDRNFTIRFGHDGTKCCILIGEITSTWSYLKVVVEDVMLGHSNIGTGNWEDGWSVDTVTTLPTITTSRSNVQVGRFGNVFYDTDNTARFVDPSGTSSLTGLTVANTITGSVSGSSGSTTGNAATVSSITNITGLSRNSLVPASNLDGLTNSNFRTTLFGSAANGSHIAACRWNASVPAPFTGLVGYGTAIAWSGQDTQSFLAVNYGAAGAVIGGGNGDNINWSAALLHSSNYTSYAMPSGLSATNSVDVRAPIFYDSNDTAYYANPNSVSNFSGLTVASRISGSISGDAQRLFSHTGANNGGLQYWNTLDNTTLNPSAGYHYGLRMGHGDADTYYSATLAVDFFGDNFYLRRKTAGTDQTWRRFWHNGDSSITATGDFRAPIFYDSANTTYYVDAASTSNLVGLTVANTITGSVTGSSASTTGNAATATTLQTARTINGVSFNGSADITIPAVGSVTATAPVVSSGGTSPVISMPAATASVNGYMTSTYAAKLNGIAAGATANTGTVTGVTGTAPIVSSGGTAPAISMPAATATVNGYMTSTFAAKLNGIAAGATANTGTVTSVSVTTANGVSGTVATSTTTPAITLTLGAITPTSVVASGNITAYSDIRVKDNVETIPSALDKLDLIRGVTYTRIDLEDKEQRYAGVIAQEIEAVLPEAVRDLGDIKAVDYNATIALLIQAVKELRDEVEMLRK